MALSSSVVIVKRDNGSLGSRGAIRSFTTALKCVRNILISRRWFRVGRGAPTPTLPFSHRFAQFSNIRRAKRRISRGAIHSAIFASLVLFILLLTLFRRIGRDKYTRFRPSVRSAPPLHRRWHGHRNTSASHVRGPFQLPLRNQARYFQSRRTTPTIFYHRHHKLIAIPSHECRFNHPWLVHPRIRTKTFRETNFRILYSTIKDYSGDGIGHAVTILNAELSAALQMGISYTHRQGHYGSLDKGHAGKVESIFGWGVGEVPRKLIENEVCIVRRISHRLEWLRDHKCPVCTGISGYSPIPVRQIVQIPNELLYGCVGCSHRQEALGELVRKNGASHTIFQMAPDRCDRNPKSPDFSKSYHFFYWKYWDLHGTRTSAFLQTKRRTAEFGRKWSVDVKRRDDVGFEAHELNIAIHARRGDFFGDRKRKMVSSAVFGRLVRHVARLARDVGGVFAEMPVAVYVFSEGRRLHGAQGTMHDVRLMDHEYVDSDGTGQDARLFHGLIVRDGLGVEGNRSETVVQKSGGFPAGLRVVFRIATDVGQSLHEMASADVFMGSASDLSEYAVRVVSRAGIQLLPKYNGFVGGCCSVEFDAEGGRIVGRRMREYWMVCQS